MNTDHIARFVAALNATAQTDQALSVLVEFARAANKAPGDFLEDVALEVGDAFSSGRMSFAQAMNTMADIYNALFPSELVIHGHAESLAYQMFWALDEGEHGHESDGQVDPIEARALPAVRRILAAAGRLAQSPARHNDA